jgi:hypothetical protein
MHHPTGIEPVSAAVLVVALLGCEPHPAPVLQASAVQAPEAGPLADAAASPSDSSSADAGIDAGPPGDPTLLGVPPVAHTFAIRTGTASGAVFGAGFVFDWDGRQYMATAAHVVISAVGGAHPWRRSRESAAFRSRSARSLGAAGGGMRSRQSERYGEVWTMGVESAGFNASLDLPTRRVQKGISASASSVDPTASVRRLGRVGRCPRQAAKTFR